MTQSKDITSVTEHRQHLKDHLRLVRETNRPLFITTNGQTEAVVLSPELYDTLAHAHDMDQDLLTMRRAMKEYENGESRPAAEFFAELRSELLAMKAARKAKHNGRKPATKDAAK